MLQTGGVASTGKRYIVTRARLYTPVIANFAVVQTLARVPSAGKQYAGVLRTENVYTPEKKCVSARGTWVLAVARHDKRFNWFAQRFEKVEENPVLAGHICFMRGAASGNTVLRPVVFF